MNENPNNNPNFRDIEAAKYLGVGRSTIWLYAKQGKLHPLKLSARVTVFPKSDLEAFIAKAAVAS